MATAVQRTQMATPSIRKATKGRRAGGSRPTAPAPEERPSRRAFLQRWMAAGLILGASLLTLLFVANALKVDELLVQITTIEAERNIERQRNDALRSKLTRLTSVEEITRRAEAMGMVQPERPPLLLSEGETR